MVMARKTRSPSKGVPALNPLAAPPDRVEVDVAPDTLVYWDGEQRGGTLNAVPYQLAAQWLRRGWALCIY